MISAEMLTESYNDRDLEFRAEKKKMLMDICRWGNQLDLTIELMLEMPLPAKQPCADGTMLIPQRSITQQKVIHWVHKHFRESARGIFDKFRARLDAGDPEVRDRLLAYVNMLVRSWFLEPDQLQHVAVSGAVFLARPAFHPDSGPFLWQDSQWVYDVQGLTLSWHPICEPTMA